MIMNGSLGIYFEVSFFEEYLKLILYGNFFEMNATTWIKIIGIYIWLQVLAYVI